jgi:hypothetical protein
LIREFVISLSAGLTQYVTVCRNHQDNHNTHQSNPCTQQLLCIFLQNLHGTGRIKQSNVPATHTQAQVHIKQQQQQQHSSSCERQTTYPAVTAEGLVKEAADSICLDKKHSSWVQQCH